MAHTSIIQILKLNEPKKGTSAKSGRAYDIQDAECILLNDDGQAESVGVLMIPNDLRGKVAPGIYTGHFAMRPDRERRIGAVLVGLTPIPPSKSK